MAIYTTKADTGYTCGSGKEGSDIVSVFIDAAINDECDTTFEAKVADGGITITTTKTFAKEIASAFEAVAS